MKLRTILQATVGLLFVALIAGYTIYQAQDFWAGPVITIHTPADGAETTKPLIQISGSAERISHLTLNGRQIFTDPNGRYSETLLLAPGYNIITVAAGDSFNRHIKKHLRVTLNASSSLLFSSYINDNEQAERRPEENQGTEEPGR